jgi:hypothetical protein
MEEHVAYKLLHDCCLAYSSALKLKPTGFSETTDDFLRTRWSCIRQDRTLHNHRCENIKLYNPNIKFYDHLFGDLELLQVDRHDDVKRRISMIFRCKHAKIILQKINEFIHNA